MTSTQSNLKPSQKCGGFFMSTEPQMTVVIRILIGKKIKKYLDYTEYRFIFVLQLNQSDYDKVKKTKERY
jgi:hypothetical protein